MLVAHLWELGSTYFDYYYLSENCSYHILGAARGGRSRGSSCSIGCAAPVIPADTVKALFANPDLVAGVGSGPRCAPSSAGG